MKRWCVIFLVHLVCAIIHFSKLNVEKKCVGYLVITSDRGLAGGYNGNVLKLMQSEIDALAKDEYKVLYGW